MLEQNIKYFRLSSKVTAISGLVHVGVIFHTNLVNWSHLFEEIMLFSLDDCGGIWL